MVAIGKLTVGHVAGLLSSWDSERNLPSIPSGVAAQSHESFWWKCERGHSWFCNVYSRRLGENGCPICSNKRVLEGFNDLATTRPDLAAEWDEVKNAPLKPSDLVAGAARKVWWKCDKGHKWEASCNSRNSGKSGCPFCSGRQSVPGETDHKTCNPKLAAQWNASRNGSLISSEVTPGSSRKVWWICSREHEWQASIYKRTGGSGCPYCSGRKPLTGESDILSQFPMPMTEWHPVKNEGSDPSQMLASSRVNVWWICENGHEYQKSPRDRLVRNVGCPACSTRVVVSGVNDLSVTNPGLAREWHPTRNLPRLSNKVLAGSNQKAWWVCSQGHDWEAVISSRGIHKAGCPYCSNQRVWGGFNDLATANPKLASEWHPSLNGSLLPTQVIAGTAARFWWRCDRGHEWDANCGSRARGSGCPYCSNQRVLAGYNDLASSHLDLMEEWDYSRNVEVAPETLVAGSNKSVWWQCSKGHFWRASVASRTSRATGCPSCARKRLEEGENDFAATDPALALEWHPTKNLPLHPNQMVASSKRKVWWLCPQHHEYLTSVGSRHSQKTGCPYCAGKKLLVGFNDLVTVNPGLAAEWHPSRNGDFTPNGVTRGSRKKAWWVCGSGHAWEATIANRVWGSGCPYCAGQWLLPGLNDLATVNPELAKQWHPTRNTGLEPSQVFSTTGKAYWWVCAEGHEWRAKVANRKWGNGCPQCSKAGYISATPGILYFIEHPEFNARKIGITNVDAKKSRVSAFVRAGWTVILQIQDENGHIILDLETEMLRWVRNDLGLPAYLATQDMRTTGGASETFTSEGVSNYQVVERINQVYGRLRFAYLETNR